MYLISKYKEKIAIILLCCTIAIAVIEQLNVDSPANFVLCTLSKKNIEKLELLSRIDSIPKTLKPHTNLCFLCKSFDNWNKQTNTIPALIFQRSAYNIYPFLLYGNAGNFTPFDNHQEKINFHNTEWLKAKDISHTVTFTKLPDKNVATNIIKHRQVKKQKERLNPGIIMIYWGISITFLLTTGFGLLISSFILKRTTPLELISISILFGMGCSAIIIQYLSMLGLRPSITTLGILGTAGLIGGFLRRKQLLQSLSGSHKFNTKEKKRWIKFIQIFTYCILLCALIIVFFNACILPLYAWDGFMIWLLKSKVLMHESLAETSFFSNRSYGFAHLKYPLLVPFIYTSFSLFIGEFNINCARSPEIFFFIAGNLLFYYILKKESKSSIFSLTLLASIFLSPVLLINCGVGVADTILSIFYCASIYYQYLYLKNNQRQDMFIAIIFTILCGLTKNEGIALSGISIVLFTLFAVSLKPNKKNIINSLIFIISILIFMLPHFIWSHQLPATDENYPQHLLSIFTIEKFSLIPGILWEFISQMLSLKFVSAIIALIFALVTVHKSFFKSKLSWILFSYFITHFCLYIFVFAITPWSLNFLYNTALNRVILHLIPVLLILAATAYGYSSPLNTPSKKKS